MLLHNAGNSEMLKLCDFGYSKDDGLGTEASGCKTACGTPEYMAPEVRVPTVCSLQSPVQLWLSVVVHSLLRRVYFAFSNKRLQLALLFFEKVL